MMDRNLDNLIPWSTLAQNAGLLGPAPAQARSLALHATPRYTQGGRAQLSASVKLAYIESRVSCIKLIISSLLAYPPIENRSATPYFKSLIRIRRTNPTFVHDRTVCSNLR